VGELLPIHAAVFAGRVFLNVLLRLGEKRRIGKHTQEQTRRQRHQPNLSHDNASSESVLFNPNSFYPNVSDSANTGNIVFQVFQRVRTVKKARRNNVKAFLRKRKSLSSSPYLSTLSFGFLALTP